MKVLKVLDDKCRGVGRGKALLFAAGENRNGPATVESSIEVPVQSTEERALMGSSWTTPESTADSKSACHRGTHTAVPVAALF